MKRETTGSGELEYHCDQPLCSLLVHICVFIIIIFMCFYYVRNLGYRVDDYQPG